MNTPEAVATPTLAAGETYVGAIIKADGTGHHIILLPGDNNAASWQAQMEWAKSIGGNLPSRIEQAMLFAYHHDAFKPTWYWSNEQPAANSVYAWYQYFDGGSQVYSTTSSKLRARAVRRVPI